MVLRPRTFSALLSFALLFAVHSVAAQTKSGAAPKAAAPKPSEPALEVKKVCVRPDGVGDKVNKWGYDRTNKLVTTDVEREVRFAGGRWVYEFDPKAALDSYRSLPLQHQKKCPNDDRKPLPPPPPEPEGILPKAGPLFPSANPLGGADASLAPRGFGSSGTTKPTSSLVNQYCAEAEGFSGTSDAHRTQAAQFAIKLRDSILSKKAVGKINSDELSPEAAALLGDHFGTKIAAAFEHAEVIAPLNVMQKLVPAGKNPPWEPFALVRKQSMTEFGMGSADSVMAIMLSRTEYDRMTNLVGRQAELATTKDSLHAVYKSAYRDRPIWLGAIKVYFAAK